MRKDEAIRWTKEKAAAEFGLNPRTLTNRIRSAGIEAGKDGCFSTADICRAVFGDIDSEKLRLTREQADKYAIENAKARGELVELKRIVEVVGRGISAVKSKIEAAANLEREDKDKIMRDCGQLWASLEDLSRADGPAVEPAAEVHG